MNKISLNGEWELSFTLPESERKISTTIAIPSNIEPTLVKLGLINDYMPADDPYATQKFEAIDDWTYVKRFNYSGAPEGYSEELVIEGIDTIAEVYLNGDPLLCCEDMHLAYRADLCGKLRPTDNELKIIIRSSELYAREHLHDMLSSSRDAVTTYDSQPRLRKARHQWGWDNAPRLLTSGIIRPIYIEQLPAKRFGDVYVYTDRITDDYVLLGANFTYITDKKVFCDHYIRISLLDGDEVIYEQTNKALFVQGSFKFSIDRDKVNLWWPNGFGEPYLYTLKLEMLERERSVAEYRSPIGIRTLKLDWTESVSESDGGCFDFVVNGEKVHIRGTNWKPLDPLASLADQKLKTGAALREISALNCNMVRIWGGGIYEDEFFFNYCDKNGIMIWQDFMFACEIPSVDDEFCALVKKEAEFIVKKYRNHPSLAVWCGDNENDEAMSWTNFNTTALPSASRVTREILKKAVLCYDPYRSYVPSSPFTADITVKERREGNERHFMTERHLYVELYDQPRALRECKSIFLGETGPFWTNAMAVNERIFAREARRAELLWNESVIEPPVRKEVIFHQDEYYFKMWRQSGKRACERLLGRDFSFSEIKDFTLALNILCSEVFKDLIEYCRISRPEKTGVIWWSLMDMFPMLFNYSVIDCDGNRKLPYYWIKQSQQPFALMAVRKESGGELSLYASNETLTPIVTEYTVTAYGEDLSARVIASGRCRQDKNSSSIIQKIAESNAPELWIIKWKSPNGNECTNHAFTRNSTYEVMRRWVEIIGKEGGFLDEILELKQ